MSSPATRGAHQVRSEQGRAGRGRFSTPRFPAADWLGGSCQGTQPGGLSTTGMDGDKDPKGKGKGKSTKGTRSRTGSVSGKSTTTMELQSESSKMAQLAAAASEKAAQRKMTDYMAPPSGAGELPSGPCGSAARSEVQVLQQGSPTNPSEESEESSSTSGRNPTTAAEAVSQLLQEARQQQSAGALMQVVQVLQDSMETGSGSGEAQDKANPTEEEGGWRTWTNRKNRRIGGDLEQEERKERSRTPFQLPGVPAEARKGYYPSANRRHIASANRSSKLSMVAQLTEEQWGWFKLGVCLGCGKKHQVKDCPLLSPAEGRALVRAALNCPADMRPGDRSAPRRIQTGLTGAGPSGIRSSGASTSARVGAGPSGASSSTAASGTPAAAVKRDRGSDNSGLTPEAKKAKMFSDAVKSNPNLVLYVREKDGGPLTKERFQALKTSFTYFVEDMLAKNKDPPICAGRWQESRTVVKIPMASEEDVLWMRCFLEKAYLVQSEEEFRKSKNKIYVAFLRDRLEPELTNMRQDKLANFIRFYRRQAKISSLFELRMAAKTTRGKAVHLVMDEEAEAIFVREGCKIPFAAAGWIGFEERQSYVARIKALERERLRPKASELEKGRATLGVERMDLDGDVEVVDLAKDSPGKEKDQDSAGAEKEKEDEETQAQVQKEQHDKRLEQRLLDNVKDGILDRGAAEAKMLELTGKPLRRTASSSSWSEEVDHMKRLEERAVPATIEESRAEAQDLAQFELRQEQVAQAGQRAAGSGQQTEGAEGSPSN